MTTSLSSLSRTTLTHAPHAGGDWPSMDCSPWRWLISIHAPMWGATFWHQLLGHAGPISIRAPRVGGDSAPSALFPVPAHFNPRPPCGGRRRADTDVSSYAGFQSTPPMRGATVAALDDIGKRPISIHAPRAGGDAPSVDTMQTIMLFQSTPPCGGRRSENSSSLHPSGSPLSA